MNNATFYIVKEQSPQSETSGFLDYVVFLAHHFAKQGAKVYVNVQDIQQAEQLAECFWQVAPENFVAHNLVGEGPRYGSPIEIGHQGVKPNWNRQLVINAAQNTTIFAPKFVQVVDFVPCEEKAKQLARERYKLYRQAGYQLSTVDIQNP